jgi:hypothetical protein
MEEQERLSGLTGEPEWKISGVIMRHGRILLFDVIYWQEIDCRFFGSFGKPKMRGKRGLSFLRRRDMESLVQQKMQTWKERVVWDYTE